MRSTSTPAPETSRTSSTLSYVILLGGFLTIIVALYMVVTTYLEPSVLGRMEADRNCRERQQSVFSGLAMAAAQRTPYGHPEAFSSS